MKALDFVSDACLQPPCSILISYPCRAVFWSYPANAPGGTKLWKFGMDQIYRPFYNTFMIKDKGKCILDYPKRILPGIASKGTCCRCLAQPWTIVKWQCRGV